MAQQGGGQPQWVWDNQRRQYYYQDPSTRRRVYQSEHASSVQSTAPRFTPAASTTADTPAPFPPPTNPASPSGTSNYVFNSRAPAASLDSAMGSLALQQQPPPQAYTAPSGIHIIEAANPHSLVRARYGTSPPHLITDPALFRAGVEARLALYGNNDSDVEQLYSNYRTRPHGFFSQGRVFMILWVEPAGETASMATTQEPSDRGFSRNNYNEPVYSKVRRFVVIREGPNYCSALPITTYGRRGVSKPHVKKSEHAIIHTNRGEAPAPMLQEGPLRGESGMRPMAIRVVPDDPVEALDPTSRVDFGKVHTIQHNIKVRPFGNVHQRSLSALQTQFMNVWNGVATVVEPRNRSPSPDRPTAAPTTYPRPVVRNAHEETIQEEVDEEDEENASDGEEDAQGQTRTRGQRDTQAARSTQQRPSRSATRAVSSSASISRQPLPQNIQVADQSSGQTRQTIRTALTSGPVLPAASGAALTSSATAVLASARATSSPNPAAHPTAARSIPDPRQSTTAARARRESSLSATSNDSQSRQTAAQQNSIATTPPISGPFLDARSTSGKSSTLRQTAMTGSSRPPASSASTTSQYQPVVVSSQRAASAQGTLRGQSSDARSSSSKASATAQVPPQRSNVAAAAMPSASTSSAWIERARAAQSAFNNLLANGYSREQAFDQLRRQIFNSAQGSLSPQEADAQTRALLRDSSNT